MAFHSIILQYSLAGLSLFSYFLFCLVCVALEDKEECSCSRAVQSFGRQQRSFFFFRLMRSVLGQEGSREFD